MYFWIFVLLITSLITIYWRYKQYGVNDAFLFFTAIYLSYNLLVWIDLPWKTNIFWFWTSGNFTIDTYTKAALLISLGSLGLFAGNLFANKLFRHTKTKVENEYRPMLLFSYAVFVFGVLLLFYNSMKVGGFASLITIPRVQRLNLLSSIRGNLPYSPFVFVGLSMITLDIAYEKKRFYNVLPPLIFWSLLMLLQGDRRFLIYSWIIVLSVFYSVRYNKVNIKKHFYFIIALLYLAFLFFSRIRWLIPPFFTRQISLQFALEWIKSDFSLKWFLPGYDEFGGPFFTLLFELSKKSVQYLSGSSYISAVSNLLPRIFFSITKPLTLSNSFSYFFHNNYMPYAKGVMGFGYSPVAEAYINFGIVGIFPVFFIFGLILDRISQLRMNGYESILIYSLLLTQLLNLNRIDFASSMQEAVYFVFLCYLLILIKKVLFVRRKIKIDS